MRRSILLGLAATGTAALTLAGPGIANASSSANGTTNVTFTLTGGSLTISTPDNADLTSGGGLTLSLTGQSVSGELGTTTVTDAQGLGGIGHTDDVQMASTDFTDATTPDAEGTIPVSDATVTTGTVTPGGSLTGLGAGIGTALNTTLNKTGVDIATVAGVVGTASMTYNPTVTVNVPSTAEAGTYSGTITQTVSSG